jgi:hypothetical protein
MSEDCAGDRDMTARLLVFAAALACAALCSAGAFAQFAAPIEGRPVTAKDISGKKFCWNNGNWIQYSADGRFENNRDHHGKWWVVRPGVIKVGESEREVDVQSDGQLHMHWYRLRAGKGTKSHDMDLWGTTCN